MLIRYMYIWISKKKNEIKIKTSAQSGKGSANIQWGFQLSLYRLSIVRLCYAASPAQIEGSMESRLVPLCPYKIPGSPFPIPRRCCSSPENLFIAHCAIYVDIPALTPFVLCSADTIILSENKNLSVSQAITSAGSWPALLGCTDTLGSRNDTRLLILKLKKIISMRCSFVRWN